MESLDKKLLEPIAYGLDKGFIYILTPHSQNIWKLMRILPITFMETPANRVARDIKEHKRKKWLWAAYARQNWL